MSSSVGRLWKTSVMAVTLLELGGGHQSHLSPTGSSENVYNQTHALRFAAFGCPMSQVFLGCLQQSWRARRRGRRLGGLSPARAADSELGLFGQERGAPTCPSWFGESRSSGGSLWSHLLPSLRGVFHETRGRARDCLTPGAWQPCGAEQPQGELTGVCWLPGPWCGSQVVTLPRAPACQYTRLLAPASFFPGSLLLAAILGYFLG